MRMGTTSSIVQAGCEACGHRTICRYPDCRCQALPLAILAAMEYVGKVENSLELLLAAKVRPPDRRRPVPEQRPGHYPQWVGTAAEVHPHPIGTADIPTTGE